jgi:hypothetical protein
MLVAVRRGLAAAVLVAAASGPSVGETTGNIFGVNEKAAFEGIQEALDLEKQAEAILLSADPFLPLDIEQSGQVKSLLELSMGSLMSLEENITYGGPYQNTTNISVVTANLMTAAGADEEAIKLVDNHKLAFDIHNTLLNAINAKRSALQALGGVSLKKKDLRALDENGTGPGTIVHDAELSGSKQDAKVTGQNVANGTGDTVDANGKVKKVPALKPSKYLSVAAAPKPVKQYYYAFEGKKSTPGYHFKTFGRQLFGPFETRFQVGAFDPNRFEDTGSACIEFDIEGSSPLQFVAVCGRRISGGVQVFVQSNAGSGGSLFVPGARIAQVLVDYDGTTFTVTAGVEGTPDEFLSLVGSATMAQGETALIAGLGASGLTKGAEIGLDEIYFTAK